MKYFLNLKKILKVLFLVVVILGIVGVFSSVSVYAQTVPIGNVTNETGKGLIETNATAPNYLQSSCPPGSFAVGFNLDNIGSNFSNTGSLYCRTFSKTMGPIIPVSKNVVETNGTAPDYPESSCPSGSVLVGFSLDDQGKNFSRTGTLYCRTVDVHLDPVEKFVKYMAEVTSSYPYDISTCPLGYALVGFNKENMGKNYNTVGSLYCRKIGFFDYSITPLATGLPAAGAFLRTIPQNGSGSFYGNAVPGAIVTTSQVYVGPSLGPPYIIGSGECLSTATSFTCRNLTPGSSDSITGVISNYSTELITFADKICLNGMRFQLPPPIGNVQQIRCTVTDTTSLSHQESVVFSIDSIISAETGDDVLDTVTPNTGIGYEYLLNNGLFPLGNTVVPSNGLELALVLYASPTVPIGRYTVTMSANTLIPSVPPLVNKRIDTFMIDVVPVATLAVALTANPPSGTSLARTITAAKASGTATGSMDYRFKCKGDDPWSSWLGAGGGTTLTVSCNYPSVGVYTAYTEGAQQGVHATANATVTVYVNPPLVPPTLTATVGPCRPLDTVTPLRLTWTAPNPNNTIGYNIYRDGVYFDSAISATTTYSTKIPGTAGSSYLFSIKAAYIGSESAAATTTSITIASCPVINTFNYSLSATPLIQIVKGQSGANTIIKSLITGTSQEVILTNTTISPAGPTIAGISNNSGLSSYPTSNSVVTIDTGSAATGTYTFYFDGTSFGVPLQHISFNLQITDTGNPPVNGTNPNGVLWINSGVSTTTAKRIRLNQSATLGWSLPSGWTGCSTDTTPPFPLIAGWNDPASLADITTEAANLQRLSNAGEFIMKIICGASSTNPIKLIVVDPNGGER